MNKLYSDLVDKLILNDIIKPNEKEIYIYGLKNLCTIMVNLLTAIALGFISKNLFETFILLCSFIPLRSYAGGIHLKTNIECYFASNLLMIIALILGETTNLFIWCILCITLLPPLFYMAPVECQLRKYDKKEKKYFKCNMKKNLGVETTIFFCCIVMGWTSIAKYIMIAIVLVEILVILGKIYLDLSRIKFKAINDSIKDCREK
ncbi:accessory gene regulator B family protein [Lachnospiraceae bacterium 29-91]